MEKNVVWFRGCQNKNDFYVNVLCVKNSPLSLFLGLEILCTGLQSCNIYDNLPDDSKSDSGDFLGAFLDGPDKQDII